MIHDFIQNINNPDARLDEFWARMRDIANNRPAKSHFVLCLAGTATSDVPGISAAGETPKMRRLTPAADAEALFLGRTAQGKTIPASPSGIVSPVVITRAALQFLDCAITIVDCGTFSSPMVPLITAGKDTARCLSTGQALDYDNVSCLFQTGLRLGAELATDCNYLIVSECVPGGTTTALGLLSAFGYEASTLLSSSLPQANHALRWSLVKQGLDKSGLTTAAACRQPLQAVAALGDPMQAVVAGLSMSASKNVPVILAGGTQMLAVWALMSLLSKVEDTPVNSSLAIVSTKWVANDSSAGTGLLASLVKAPFAVSSPNFLSSRHQGLRAYEDGHVKEGVGAGGAMAAAHVVGGAQEPELLQSIDKAYDEMVIF